MDLDHTTNLNQYIEAEMKLMLTWTQEGIYHSISVLHIKKYFLPLSHQCFRKSSATLKGLHIIR